MNLDYTNMIINGYFSIQNEVFSFDDFYFFLKHNNLKITKQKAKSILETSNLVFSFDDDMYITRAGIFSHKLFTIKPTKEEVSKGYFVIGHRCMPFINPVINPDSLKLTSSNKLLEPKPVRFSMNLAESTFYLYGKGFYLSYIYADAANTTDSINDVQYGELPNEVTLTAWPLDKIVHKGPFQYGDRLLCHVVDWAESTIEIVVLREKSKNAVLDSDIEREDWYRILEKKLLESLEKYGPLESIEDQLKHLYVENFNELCIKNCGSIEEFFMQTKKLEIVDYGIDSRIWKTGEIIPVIGHWNKDEEKSDSLILFMIESFTAEVTDAYIKYYLQKKNKKKNENICEQICHEVFPYSHSIPFEEYKNLLLNIEKRHDILKRSYVPLKEQELSELRNRAIQIFTQVNSLLFSIGYSGLSLTLFPRQEFISLKQVYTQLIAIIARIEFLSEFDQIDDDLSLAIEVMEFTFDEISQILKKSLEVNRYKNMKIIE